MYNRFLAAILVASLPIPAFAGDDADVDKMTTWATVIGRANACGISSAHLVGPVERWFQRTWKPDAEGLAMVDIYNSGMKMSRAAQLNGSTGMTCFQVRLEFDRTQFPK